MSFAADIVAVKKPYDPSNNWPVIYTMNTILATTFGIKIHSEISFDQYLRESASKPLNRYLRMPVDIFKKLMPHANLGERADSKDTIDLQYDAGRSESPKFANSRHFVVSFSSMDEYTLIWFNFHPALYQYLYGFSGIHTQLARNLSIKYNTETISMHTTSISRSDASFVMYSNGNKRGEETGKDALTVLKNDYHIDINKCMDNIDNNIAIYYAPFDLATVNKQIYEQNKRFEEFQACSEKLILEDKVTGENMVAGFMEDNEKICTTLMNKRARIAEAMQVEGFGTLLFLALDREPVKVSKDLKSETFFGRKK